MAEITQLADHLGSNGPAGESAATIETTAAALLPVPTGSATDCFTAAQLQWLRETVGSKDTDDVTAEELSAALGLAETIRCRGIVIEDAFERLQFAVNCLIADKPKLLLARDERVRLQLDVYRHSGILTAVLARLSAGSSTGVVLTALLASTFIWTGIVFCIHFVSQVQVSDLAHEAFFMNGRALVVVTSGAFIGGVISIATRLRDFSRVRDLDPFSMFWTALLKPLIGVVVALFVLATLAGQIISFGFLGTDPLLLAATPDGSAPVPDKTLYVLWVLGFLSGFSERFAWDFVDRVEGVARGGMGGDSKTPPTGT